MTLDGSVVPLVAWLGRSIRFLYSILLGALTGMTVFFVGRCKRAVRLGSGWGVWRS